jgi:hypothetical protein
MSDKIPTTTDEAVEAAVTKEAASIEPAAETPPPSPWDDLPDFDAAEDPLCEEEGGDSSEGGGKGGGGESEKNQSELLTELLAILSIEGSFKLRVMGDGELLATILREIVVETPPGEPTIPSTHYLENRRTDDPEFLRWIRSKFFSYYEKPVNGASLKEGIALASSISPLCEHTELETSLRVAGTPDHFFIDLGRTDWKVIEVTRDEWKLTANATALAHNIFFVRPAGAKALPFREDLPPEKGDLRYLRPFVNGSDDEYFKVVAWLLTALHPKGPYPPLLISGSQGSAKSTLSRFLVKLTDSRTVVSADLPSKTEELPVLARHCHVLNFDNISHIDTAVSNSLCRLATGGGIAKRALYTDGDLAAFGGRRPCILNGIGALASRGDLVDRSIFLKLERIKKFETEETLDHKWNLAAPIIFTGLLNALVGCSKGRSATRFDGNPPRMSDAVMWVEGAAFCGRVPWKHGHITKLMQQNLEESEREILENDLVAGWLLDQMEGTSRFSIKPREMIRRIFEYHHENEIKRLCPHSTQLLHKKLAELEPLLGKAGICFWRKKLWNTWHLEFWKEGATVAAETPHTKEAAAGTMEEFSGDLAEFGLQV